jgi:DNA topoisomerase-1
MGLDGALEKLLPELIQPEFTAQMEAALDTIAQGKQDWQGYLTGWHRTYFAPALAKAGQLLQANSVLSGNAAQSSKGAAARSPNCNPAKTTGNGYENCLSQVWGSDEQDSIKVKEAEGKPFSQMW